MTTGHTHWFLHESRCARLRRRLWRAVAPFVPALVTGAAVLASYFTAAWLDGGAL